MTNLRIRKLVSRDAKCFRALILQGLRDSGSMFAGSFLEKVKKPLSYFMRELASAKYFGAWLGQKLVGVLQLQRSSSPKTKHKALLRELYIDKNHRRHGVARELIVQGCELMKRSGVEQIRLAVRSDNRAAKKLYRSLGFRKYGQAPQALKIGQQYYADDLLIKFL